MNPYEDPPSPDLETRMAQCRAPAPETDVPQVRDNAEAETLPKSPYLHGLDVLSEVAAFPPQRANMLKQATSDKDTHFDLPLEASASAVMFIADSNSPQESASGPTSHSFENITHPVSALDSPIDPNLMSPRDIPQIASSNATMLSPAPPTDNSASLDPTSDHQEAFLLRHFAELPGKWCVMEPLSCD